MSADKILAPSCPLPLATHPKILMAHGGGGRMMNMLIEKIFKTAFPHVQNHDGAILNVPQEKIIMTTDSFVVRPLFFPGGNIGTLAVNGTVNDIAMCGARPRYLSAGFILEEGLPMETLWDVVQSMSAAADAAGITLITGDTKVVERGQGGGIYINTAGIGVLEHDRKIAPSQIKAGDSVLVCGDIGRHGMAVMAVREGLSFSNPVESDCAPLAAPVMALLDAGIDVHCLRDVTRGGLAAVLNELAEASGLQIDCVENAIPLDEKVRAACEILGLDPLHVAGEGCFAVFVAANDTDRALDILKRHNKNTTLAGGITKGKAGLVTMETPIGGRRILDMPSGELLPRIC